LFKNGRCLQSHYLAKGLHVTIYSESKAFENVDDKSKEDDKRIKQRGVTVSGTENCANT
jgi:hypothetical protein